MSRLQDYLGAFVLEALKWHPYAAVTFRQEAEELILCIEYRQGGRRFTCYDSVGRNTVYNCEHPARLARSTVQHMCDSLAKGSGK